MRMQLNIDVFARNLGEFLGIHQMKGTRAENLFEIESELIGQHGKTAVFHLSTKQILGSKGTEPLGCFVDSCHGVERDRYRQSDLPRICEGLSHASPEEI